MLSRIGILTDSTVQFSNPFFPGYEIVNVIPHTIQIGDHSITDHKDLKQFYQFIINGNHTPLVQPPSIDAFRSFYSELQTRYDAIIVILLSAQLSSAYSIACRAVEMVKSSSAIYIVDSQTISVGLGLLVQMAAEACLQGQSEAEINRLVRGMIRRIYTILCLPDLIYLHRAGYLDPAQAVVGQMLGIIPFYLLESGKLVPLQKARSSRNLVDILHEFITEIDHIHHLAMIQGIPTFEQEIRNLRERVNFDGITVSEHTLGIAMATLLGPQSFGLIAMEKPK